MKIVCSITFFILGVVLMIFFLNSFEYLQHPVYGIVYHTFRRNIEPNKVYPPGRYFIGLLQTFRRFSIEDIKITYDNFTSRVSNRNEISFSVTMAIRYRRDSMTKLYQDFPSMNSLLTIKREIEDVMFKTPEQISEEQFKYNKTIPTIMMAQKISAQIETFHCQLIYFHLNSFRFNEGSVEQRYIDYVKTERLAATTSFKNLISDVSGYNAFLGEKYNVQKKKDEDTSNNFYTQRIQEANNIYNYKVRTSENIALFDYMKNNTQEDVQNVLQADNTTFATTTGYDFDLGMTYSQILTYKELLSSSTSAAQKVYNWDNVTTVIDER